MVPFTAGKVEDYTRLFNRQPTPAFQRAETEDIMGIVHSPYGRSGGTAGNAQATFNAFATFSFSRACCTTSIISVT